MRLFISIAVIMLLSIMATYSVYSNFNCLPGTVKNSWVMCEEPGIQTIFEQLGCDDACCSDITCSVNYACAVSDIAAAFSRARTRCIDEREGPNIKCGIIASMQMATPADHGLANVPVGKCFWNFWGCECENGQLPDPSGGSCDVTYRHE